MDFDDTVIPLPVLYNGSDTSKMGLYFTVCGLKGFNTVISLVNSRQSMYSYCC